MGLSRAAISNWTSRGRLHRVHRGVYAVGHAGLGLEGRWMAAVLACGDGAVLSHMSAAALWGLLRPEDGPIDVSLPSQTGRRRRRGIRVHRCTSLAAGREAHLSTVREQMRLVPLVTVRRGIPVTTVHRTVDDLRQTVPRHLARRARRQAELAGYRLGEASGGPHRTRSDLEDDFLAFLRRHRLPAPEVNVRVGRREVDFLWREARVVVETDFHMYHRGSVAFEDDHQRDLELRLMGFTVRRYTGAQVRNHPAEVVADLREILG